VPPRKGQIHVLVVDDSAVVRQLLSALLSEGGDMTVAVAADPYIALHKMEQQRPDVIVLDLEMPRMDGMTFLRKVMREDPIPVVVCSGYAGKGSEAAVRALEEGAVEVLAKPKVGLREFLYESAVTLTDAVRAAAQAKVRRSLRPAPKLSADAVLPARPPRLTVDPSGLRVVAMGASTGGTEALHFILAQMPETAPPLVIVQHMPEGFTAAFAKRLHDVCRIEVKEAADGDAVTPGRALIAPGNLHTMLVRRGNGYAVEVRDGPLVCRHRPSADVLFRSFAQVAGPAALGVILTGMGNDGSAGLLEMKQAGAATFAQSEETCVVFGMPKEAIALKAVDEILPLPEIPQAVLQRAALPAVRRRAAHWPAEPAE
jgi:two-component system, chemotaxis family, protein-glutamate methylesterase/glutaminase